MKANRFIFFIAIISVVTYSHCYAESDDKAIVVRVAGSAITTEDFNSYLDARPIASGKEASRKALEARLEEMITSEVLYKEAIRLEIDRDPEIRLTIRQILAQKLINEQVNRPVREREITEAELQKYYNDHTAEFARPEQVRLADIFIAVPEDANPDTRNEKRRKAEEALANVLARQGRFVFGEMMAKYSDKPVNYKLGDTGFFDREGSPIGLDKEMVEGAFGLSKNGEILNNVIETKNGFHVIMLVGKRSAFSRNLEDVAKQLEKRIRREELAKKRKDYIQSLRKQAKVRIDDQVLEEIIERLKKPEMSRASGGHNKNLLPPRLPGER